MKEPGFQYLALFDAVNSKISGVTIIWGKNFTIYA